MIKSNLVPWWTSGGPSPPPNPSQAARKNISFQLKDLESLQMPVCSRLWCRICCSQSLFRDSFYPRTFFEHKAAFPGARLTRCLPQAPVCASGIASLSLLPSKWILWLHRELRLLTLNHTRVRCLKETVQILICLVNNSVNSNGTMRRFPPTLHSEVKFVSFSHLWVLARK